MQGFQGEPKTYTLQKPKSWTDVFNFVLFILMIVFGGLFLVNMMFPDFVSLLGQDASNFINILISIPHFIFGVAKNILEIPNTIMDHVSHDMMK